MLVNFLDESIGHGVLDKSEHVLSLCFLTGMFSGRLAKPEWYFTLLRIWQIARQKLSNTESMSLDQTVHYCERKF